MSYRIVAILFLVIASACTNNERPNYLYADLMQSSYLDSVASVSELSFQIVDLGAMSDSITQETERMRVFKYASNLNLDTVGLMGMVNSCSFVSDSTIVVGLSTGEVALIDHHNLKVLKRFSIGKGPGEFIDPRFIIEKDGVILVNDGVLMRSTLIDASNLQALKYVTNLAYPFTAILSEGELTYMDAKEIENGFILSRVGIADTSVSENFRIELAFENLDWIHNRTYKVSAVGDWYLIFSKSIPHLMVFDRDFNLKHVVSFKHDEIPKGFTDPIPDHIQFSPPTASWRKLVYQGVYSDGSRALVYTLYGFVVLDFNDWVTGTDIPWEFIPKISLETTLAGSEAHSGLEYYNPIHVSMKGNLLLACPVRQDFVDFFEISVR